MVNIKIALRTLFKSPFVTAVAVLSLASASARTPRSSRCSIRRCCVPFRWREPERLVDLAAPGPNRVRRIVQPDRRVRRGLLLADVPGPREGEHGFSAISPRTTASARTSRTRADLSAGGCWCRDRTSRCSDSSGARSADRPDGRRPDRRELRGGAQLRLLGRRSSAATRGLVRHVVNGQTMTIIGVAPKGFEGTTLGMNRRFTCRSPCARR